MTTLLILALIIDSAVIYVAYGAFVTCFVAKFPAVPAPRQQGAYVPRRIPRAAVILVVAALAAATVWAVQPTPANHTPVTTTSAAFKAQYLLQTAIMQRDTRTHTAGTPAVFKAQAQQQTANIMRDTRTHTNHDTSAIAPHTYNRSSGATPNNSDYERDHTSALASVQRFATQRGFGVRNHTPTPPRAQTALLTGQPCAIVDLEEPPVQQPSPYHMRRTFAGTLGTY